MARTRRPRSESTPSSSSEPQAPDSASIPPIGAGISTDGAETTGRFLIVYKDEAMDSPNEILKSLNNVAGIAEVASAADYDDSAITPEDAASAEALYFPALGIAVVSADDARVQSLMSSASSNDSNILAIEPEYVYRALSDLPLQTDYLRGYRDAVNHLYDQLTGKLLSEDGFEIEAIGDTAQFTWGLQATRVNTSRFSGRGIRVAVLDTGLDFNHPDFVGRRVTSQSFVSTPTAQDGHSHGTHCSGTACGSQRPPTGVRRYGCAFNAELHIGKVLANSGSSEGSSVLNGMNWAVTNRCQVISMSLGANVNQISQAFEMIGRRALQAGCLIIAAAGNNASRPSSVGFVGQPANSPSIMAVGALDSNLRIAPFSARSSSLTGEAGKVDIAAPGVSVFSSVPVNRGLHAFFNGTSMATPHVAGIAALWAEATGRTGAALWTTLTQNARRIAGDARDIGTGLVQAPQ